LVQPYEASWEASSLEIAWEISLEL
jgi:hypothetical protein